MYKDEPLGLTVLCGGEQQTRSVEIMGGEEMGRLIARLRERADLVILDTPPSAMLVDAMFLARHADGVVYVVMNDYAKRRFIFKGIEDQQLAALAAGCIAGRFYDSGQTVIFVLPICFYYVFIE